MNDYLIYMTVLGAIALVYLIYASYRKWRLKKFINQSK